MTRPHRVIAAGLALVLAWAAPARAERAAAPPFQESGTWNSPDNSCGGTATCENEGEADPSTGLLRGAASVRVPAGLQGPGEVARTGSGSQLTRRWLTQTFDGAPGPADGAHADVTFDVVEAGAATDDPEPNSWFSDDASSELHVDAVDVRDGCTLANQVVLLARASSQGSVTPGPRTIRMQLPGSECAGWQGVTVRATLVTRAHASSSTEGNTAVVVDGPQVGALSPRPRSRRPRRTPRAPRRR